MWGDGSDGVRDVLENGLFLGKFKIAAYSSVEFPISRGTWALLYTDGIPEAANSSDAEFGAERFREFLARERYASADKLADGLLEDLSRWSGRGLGHDFDDDLTVVAIRVVDE
jgi:sigma-B regulation protein RsbU (phosphoserine phosphatase)/two-component system sensor histidine kinase ChiS